MLNLEQLAELLEKNRAAASARVKEFSIGGKHSLSIRSPPSWASSIFRPIRGIAKAFV